MSHSTTMKEIPVASPWSICTTNETAKAVKVFRSSLMRWSGLSMRVSELMR